MNGFFVIAEFSLVSVRRTRIDELIAQECRRGWSARQSKTQTGSSLRPNWASLWPALTGLDGEPAFADLLARC